MLTVLVIVVMLVLMLVIVSAAAMLTVLVIVVMLVVMMRFLFKPFKLLGESIGMLHSRQNLLAAYFCKRGSYDFRRSIQAANERNCFLKLLLAYLFGMAEHNAACILNLVVKEFAKILHIHFALCRIYNGCAGINFRTGKVSANYRFGNVAKLANAGRFNYNPIGRKLLVHLFKCLGKIANERAANTAGIHLGNLNSGILHKSAVNANFTKLVFYKNKLLALIRL